MWETFLKKFAVSRELTIFALPKKEGARYIKNTG
jgi:hypothetical protein